MKSSLTARSILLLAILSAGTFSQDLVASAGMLSVPAARAAGENTNSSTDKFLIIVGNSLYRTGLITTALNTYQQDLQDEGWTTTLITVNKNSDATADYICPDETDLKNVIKYYYDQGYDGFVIVGSPSDIPMAWWKYKFTDPDNTKSPTDLYFADMDDWIAKDGDVYVSYDAADNFVGADFGPEMFFGRISAGPNSSTLEEEAAKVVFYLEKIHAYRVSGGNLTTEQSRRAFVFRDDDWSHKAAEFEPYHEATPNITVLVDPTLSNAARLGHLLEEGYRFGDVWEHTGSNCFNLAYMANLDIKVNYINLFVCGALDYREANVGAAFIFNTGKTCNVTGAIGGWGISPDFDYYSQLNVGTPIGIAFQNMANRQIAEGQDGWPKGTLLGDPLLEHTMNVSNRPPRIVNDLRDLTASPNQPFEFAFLSQDPEGDQVTVSIEDLPADMSWQGNTLSWAPSQQDAARVRRLTVKVVDNHNNCYREEFDIHVQGMRVESFANADFEAGSGGEPEFWETQSANCAAVFRWEPAGVGHNGTRCVSIVAPNSPDDACWKQGISTLEVGHEYLLQGWIKGANIVSHEAGDIGANLCLFGSWEFSQIGFGTFDWRLVQLKFKAESESVTIGCRLGYWGNMVTGTAWFDDMTLSDLTPTPAGPELLFAAGDIELIKPALTEGGIHSNQEVVFEQGKPSIHRGNVSAVEGVYVGEEVTINGDITAPVVDNLGRVNGEIHVQTVDPLPFPNQPEYSPNNDNRVITGNVALSPGHYGNIIVEEGSAISLRAGEYHFRRLEMNRDARANFDVSSGLITVCISSAIKFKGNVQFNAFGDLIPSSKVNLWYGNKQTINVSKNSVIDGCNLHAWNARVVFGQNSFFRGYVCAGEIMVQKNATLVKHGSSVSHKTAPILAGDDAEDNETIDSAFPQAFELRQNHPNPFNPATTIEFAIPLSCDVTLRIYNVLGEEVATLVSEKLPPGNYKRVWSAENPGSGVYFYRLQAGTFMETRKLLLVR